MALEPPPMQAMSESGRRPSRSTIWLRTSVPMIDWKSRTIAGYGCGPAAVPMQ